MNHRKLSFKTIIQPDKSPVHDEKNIDETGTVVWICGLPGSGKTTMAYELKTRLAPNGFSCVVIDGDEIRDSIDREGPADYSTRSGRLSMAMIYNRLARLFARQGLTVIVATVSMFPEIYALNRETINQYVEVLLSPDESTLKQRNKKGLYSADRDPHNADNLFTGYEPPTAPHITSKSMSHSDRVTTINQIVEEVRRHEN